MGIETKRVSLKKGTDLASMAEAVREDKAPRVLEEDGDAVAVVVSIEDFRRILLEGPSREGIERALATAGAWADSEDDSLSDYVRRSRHESPPSKPLDS